MLSVINLLAVFTPVSALQLLCGNVTDAVPNGQKFLSMMIDDVYKLFEINRLIAINFWQFID